MSTRNENPQDRNWQAAMRKLPRERDPGRDLWPGIAARIARDQSPGNRTALLQRGLRYALAASLVLGLGLVIGLQLQQQGAGPQSGPVTAQTDLASDPAVKRSARRGHLIRAVAADNTRLQPATREQMQKELAEINSAIGVLHQALARDPDNAALRDLLYQAYRDESRVLAAIQRLETRYPTHTTL